MPARTTALFSIAVALAAVTPATATADDGAGFQLNLVTDVIRQATEAYAVGDLAVGASGYLEPYNLCQKNGRLVALADIELAELDKYGAKLEITRKPNHRAQARIVMHDDVDDKPQERLKAINTLSTTPSCKLYAAWINTDPEDAVLIESVNGETSLKALFERYKPAP